MRTFIKTLILLLMVLMPLNSLSARESPMTVSIRGDVRNPMQWSVEQLKKQFAGQIKEVKFMNPMTGKERIGTGIPLLSIIKAAGPRVEKETKWTRKDKMHRNLVFFVILEARDSFRAFFSLAELMPRTGSARAWLVWKIDGKPLSGKEAPLRLVITNNSAPDRDIYGISSITLVDGNKIADQLEAK